MPYKSKDSKNLNILKKWAKKQHSLTVVFDSGQEDRYLAGERLVVINSSQTDENQCYSLLHELGHALNRDKSRGGSFRKKFNLLTEAEETGKEPLTYAFRIQFLEEEMSAWRNGQYLSERLQLKIDYGKYLNYASKCLMGYVDWVSARDWEHPICGLE